MKYGYELNRFARMLERVLRDAAYALALPFVLFVLLIPDFWIIAFAMGLVVALYLAWLQPGRKQQALPVIGLLFCLAMLWAVVRFSGYVGYGDRLSAANVGTYAVRNWGWDADDHRNTGYITQAITRLGDAAYGLTFGALMDSQKQQLAQQGVTSIGPVAYGPQQAGAQSAPVTYWATTQGTYKTSSQLPFGHVAVVPYGGNSQATGEQRAIAQRWWHAHISIFSDDVASDFAGASFGIRNGNLIAASAYLQAASHDADTLRLNDVPAGWDDVADALAHVRAATKIATQQWRDFIDDGLPSEAVDAETFDRAVSRDIRHARLLAEQRYVQMGGNEADL